MSPRNQRWTVSLALTAAGFALGVVTTTVRATIAAKAYAREVVTEIATELDAPIKRGLDDHLDTVAREKVVMFRTSHQLKGGIQVLCEDRPAPVLAKCMRALTSEE